MGHSSCCVVNCKNNGVNSKCKFYTFPKAKHKIEQRKRWIAAVRRINSVGTPWHPTPSSCICSAHFVDNKKSEEESSRSYVPSIFPAAYGIKAVNHNSSVERHNRRKKRRDLKMKSSIAVGQEVTKVEMEVNNSNIVVENITENQSYIKLYADQECQANIFFDCTQPEKTFICNRYIYENNCCHAEVQTNIIESIKIEVADQKQFKDKQCGTVEKTFVDQFVQADVASSECEDTSNFHGFSSVTTEEQLLDLAGLSFENFEFLLKAVKNNSDSLKISAENALLIFLIKMKTGLTFSAISVLFNVHRTTVSRIFYLLLQVLSAATSDLVFWPAKDIVQGTMPKCFYPDYANTRVIIDCTELRIEVPESIDNRVYTYSQYKKGFTAKVLIGITPGGFISFLSKVAGGRKSDSQITIESGLIDLLEDGDVVLADKGFPNIRQTIDGKGKQVVVVMPPFLEIKSEFTKEETEETYNIAKVRIHVERIMQRLRIYQILNKIPVNLFNCIDDIVHMCCVLVNLQPPIFIDNDQ